MRRAVAESYLRMQDVVALGMAVSLQTDHIESQSFSTTTICYDETELELCVPYQEHDPTQGRWHVMVCTVHTTTGLVPACGSYVPKLANIVKPPVVVINVRAPCLWHALFMTTDGKKLRSQLRYSESTASLSSLTWVRDGASSNYCITARYAELYDKPLISDKLCSAHSHKKIESDTTTVAGMPLISHLYSGSLLLRMGSSMFKFHASLDLVIDTRLVLRIGPPPADAAAYADEVIDYMVSNYTPASGKTPKKKRGKRTKQKAVDPALAKDAYHQLWKALARDLNGRWFDSGSDPNAFGPLPHYCENVQCCNGYDLDVCRAKVKRSLRKACYRSRPRSPNEIKWNNLGPCLDWVLSGCCVGSTVNDALGNAFNDAFISQVESKAQQFDENQKKCTAEFRRDFNWHRLLGKRAISIKALFRDIAACNVLIMLAIVEEPLRYVLNFLLGASSVNVQRDDNFPAICTCANPFYSPIVVARQAYSSLLAGRSSRLQILYKRAGVDSFAMWIYRFPREAMAFRRIIRPQTALVVWGSLYRLGFF